jgi:peptidyl-prolyl cis-trans isomerase SurA
MAKTRFSPIFQASLLPTPAVWIGLFLLGLPGAAQAATNATPPAWLMDGVAAQVNDETITISEVMNEIRNSAWIEMPKEEREKSLRKLYTETLDAFINRRLILAAARAADLKLQAWVVEDRVQDIVDSRYKGNRTLLMNDLTEHRVNFEEWRKGIEEEMMLMAMRSENVDKHVTVSPREVRGYYETNRLALVTSARVHLGRITLPPQPSKDQTVEQLGAVALQELDAGTEFATVARKYSKDDYAPRGGDRGWLDLDDLAPRLVQTLATVKTGQCSRLVMLGETGMILQKIEEKAAGQPTLDEAWTQIERRLRLQKSETIYQGWTARLRQQGFVKLFELPPTSAER